MESRPKSRSALFETFEFTLDCGTLRLRPTVLKDRGAIASVLADEKVTRYLAALPYPLDDTALNTYLNFLCGSDQVSKTIELNGEFAGVISLARQLTFWVARKHWRRGLAGCAVNWLVDTHFAQPDSSTLFAQVHIQNSASIALLKKLGFEQIGPVKRRFSFVTETAEEFVGLELSRSAWVRDRGPLSE
ncbi:GNAT family N-acetyltransferase [Roseibium sp.]|uniref:GNAT family N-acetyltransferase n=1 Tax=Roseibium sp. TaxID=1936156 RepID=UPI00261FF474|nr:GNAT family N-acetyltransferase [Roseibium sp.]